MQPSPHGTPEERSYYATGIVPCDDGKRANLAIRNSSCGRMLRQSCLDYSADIRRRFVDQF
jgi:hypothetical protein